MRRARYLVVIGVVLAGCGETTIDADKLEGEIAQGVEEQTGTRNVSVDCPDDVKAEKGGTFECEVTAPGGVKANAPVTQTDDDGNVEWRLKL